MRSRVESSPQSPARTEGLKQLSSDESLPPYCKLLADVLIDTKKELADLARQCRDILAENRSLIKENLLLRKQISSLMSCNTLSESQGHVEVASSNLISSDTASAVDADLQRSIVIAGVPEYRSLNSVERANHDYQCICSILSFLDIECIPSVVYRMGVRNSNRPRLIKVVMPSSKFQRQAVQRAPRLRFFSHKGVYLRPSLTKEERERRRKERLGSLSSPQDVNVGSAPVSLSSSSHRDQSTDVNNVSTNVVRAGNLS
ncbi:unnamed protein product [Haemonchus placei]|uniref:Uncharacterized protein n=1 Tax=Haemonchus placei TaxID=6290 RepID=A0A0N4X980_HAEPC|nr:unnamed protein product [Haemonchus placei]